MHSTEAYSTIRAGLRAEVVRLRGEALDGRAHRRTPEIVANLALGMHLFHGLWSLFQSLGWNHPKLNPWRRRFAVVFATAVTLGNVSLPIAVLLGVVR